MSAAVPHDPIADDGTASPDLHAPADLHAPVDPHAPTGSHAPGGGHGPGGGPTLVPAPRHHPAGGPDDHAPADGVPPAAVEPVRRVRDQYIDGLRALALIRVMTYHTFGWAWLPVLFPSMGVMFALGGSLMAASLSKVPGEHWSVLRRRMRRLLPPLWLYGAVLVTVMAVHGWTWTETSGSRLTWSSALTWWVPAQDPPGSAWGYDFVLPLWYIRTYLWLMLLSPMLLWLLRRYPVTTLLTPFAVLAMIMAGALDPTTATGDTIEHLAVFGACWLLGFAHHDGLIRRLPRGRTVLGALVLMALGLGYALTHVRPDTGWDIDNIDVANALYSVGAVLLLLRLYPRRTFLDRTPRLSGLVSAMNSRAMTIYLWGNFAIWAATPVMESNRWTIRLETGGWLGSLDQFLVAWLVLLVIVLAVGWAEDVAAGRGPRVNPWPRATTRPVTTRSRSRGSRRPTIGIGVIGVALAAALGGALLVQPASAVEEQEIVPLPVAGPVAPGPYAPPMDRFPLHPGIQATVFWVGAISRSESGANGQSLASAWDRAWATHFGGCDGVGTPGLGCASDLEQRRGPDWFPTRTVPAENPYYVGLPYNDLTSPKTTDRRQIPWSGDPGYAARIHDRTVSFVKNRWVSVQVGAANCYAQVEDSGPGTVDPGYVLGTARPRDSYGLNLSPALFRCLGLDPQRGTGLVDWRFVPAPPPGPWARVITTRQVG